MKKIDISTRKYPNTFALVDDSDYDWLNQWKWCATPSKGGELRARRSRKKGAKYRTLHMTRLIMNASNNLLVDHRNHNTLDNRRCNLRLATKAQNQYNMLSRKSSSSQYKGVCWDKSNKNWQANICLDRKPLHIGVSDSEIECAKMYDIEAKKLFGEFAYLNFHRKTTGN